MEWGIEWMSGNVPHIAVSTEQTLEMLGPAIEDKSTVSE